MEIVGMEKATRRELLSATVLGSGTAAFVLALNLLAQESEAEVKLGDIDPRTLHRQQVENARRSLNGYQALSREGIEAALRSIMEANIIKDEDYGIIMEAIHILFDIQQTSEQKARAIADYYDRVQDNIGDVAKVILAAETDSAEYAVENLPNHQASFVSLIAHDVRGAIDGASTGAALGRKIGLTIPGALIGALAGGASGSIIAYFG